MQKCTYICWIHTDAIIIKTPDDKNTGINDAHRKTQEDFFIKYFNSHFICKVSKRVTQSLRVKGSWRPNITEIFWPRSYVRQCCVFLVLPGCSTGALAFLTTSRLPSQLYSPVSTGSLNPTDRNSTVLCSIRRPYITFKLPRGDMDTPPQRLPISSDRDVSLPLSLEWPVWSSSCGNNCHPVQRSLSSGASVYESIMGFFFYLVPFHLPISALAISSHECHQNVSLPSGALPWMAFLAGSTGQNITHCDIVNNTGYIKMASNKLHYGMNYKVFYIRNFRQIKKNYVKVHHHHHHHHHVVPLARIKR